jgi:8-oxo-dGTP pyrophosphatase MutT (NUDIX family)/GNAT superfamily N-acetyltransferase
MGGVVSRLGPEHSGPLARLWQAANDRRTTELGLAAIVESAPVLARPGSFGVGVLDGDVLVSAAVAMPARADDGRSSRNVAGLAHISSVATDPSRWGEGLATVSVTAVMSQARRRGYARCQLWVLQDNAVARHVYEKAGFERSGRPARSHDRDAPMVHYVTELTAARPITREAARVLCLDDAGRVLLMHWRDSVDGHQLWEPPGGGVEPGEEPIDAVRREWVEETGLPVPVISGAPTNVARDVFWAGGRLVGEETFFLARMPAALTPEPAALTASERVEYLGSAWVGRSDYASAAYHGDPVEPDLLPVLERLAA